MNAKTIPLTILILLCCLATAASIGADEISGRTHSTENVRFVIHIPETLKLSISTTSILRRDLTTDIDTISPHRLPMIEAIGQLTHGAAMALTADTNTSRSEALAMLTWTAGGMAVTGGRRSDAFTPKGDTPELNAYLYRKEIPSDSFSHASVLNYILCSP